MASALVLCPRIPGFGFNSFTLVSAILQSPLIYVDVVCCSRCLAVLHCYYRFKKIHRLGSAFIMKIAASYLAFTLVLFLLIATSLGPPSSMKVRLLYDSWFMVLLLMDMQVKVRQGTTGEVQISKIRAKCLDFN